MSAVEEMRAAAARMRGYDTRFWSSLAEWIDRHARDLDSAGGDLTFVSYCDSPADVEQAAAVAHEYLHGGA